MAIVPRVVAAVVTPCREPGVVGADAMQRLCHQMSSHGCDGLFVVSSTGEAVLLDESDRRVLISAARRGVQGEVHLYAGVTGLGAKQTILYANNAAADGANVAVVMAPFFLKLGQRELVEYFVRVADVSPIPVALYHHPRMSTTIDVETLVSVAAHPNIIAIKDTSGTTERAKAVIEATRGLDFAVLQGSEHLSLFSLRAGCHGVLAALAGIAPEWHAELVTAARRGDWSAAELYDQQIMRLWRLFEVPGVGDSISAFAHAIKLGLARRGWLAELSPVVPGFAPAPEFESAVESLLDHVKLPQDRDWQLRIDQAHPVGEGRLEVSPVRV